MNDEELRTYLSGGLILLCLLLLWCWYNKQNNTPQNYRSRFTNKYNYGYLRPAEGMTSGRPSDLQFKKPSNMNDRENYVVNRHPLTNSLAAEDSMKARWNVDTFVPGSSIELDGTSGKLEDRDNYARNRRKADERVVDGVESAYRARDNPGQFNSLSNEILAKTDFTPSYGMARGTI